MVKYLHIGIIFGFINMLLFFMSSLSMVSFEAFMVLFSWIILFAFIYSSQWFDKVTEGYFKVVVLLFLAARLARSHSKEFGKECAYIAAGFSLGLITKAIYKNQVWTTLFLLGIIAIEVVNLELSDQIGGADLTQFIPPFESIDSKFSLDPTNW